MSRQFLNKSLTALRVGVTTVHEAMYKGIFDAVFFCNVNQLEEMIE